MHAFLPNKPVKAHNENIPFPSPSTSHGRGLASTVACRISSGAEVTLTLPWLSISAPSVEYRIFLEVSSCSISCTTPRGSLGNQMTRCPSTAAGWLNSVGHSAFIGRADGEGDDARDPLVNEGAAVRFRSLSVMSSGSRGASSLSC